MSVAYLRDLFPAGGVSCYGGKTAHYMALPYKIGVVAPLLADTQHLLPYNMGVSVPCLPVAHSLLMSDRPTTWGFPALVYR